MPIFSIAIPQPLPAGRYSRHLLASAADRPLRPERSRTPAGFLLDLTCGAAGSAFPMGISHARPWWCPDQPVLEVTAVGELDVSGCLHAFGCRHSEQAESVG